MGDVLIGEHYVVLISQSGLMMLFGGRDLP